MRGRCARPNQWLLGPVTSRKASISPLFWGRTVRAPWIGGFGLPDSATALGTDPEVRVLACKDVTAELLCGQSRVAWITRHLATAVADTTDNPNELGMRVSRKLLHLVEDTKRRPWVRLLGGEHQAEAFPGHALNDVRAAWIRSRIVAEGAVKKCLHRGR